MGILDPATKPFEDFGKAVKKGGEDAGKFVKRAFESIPNPFSNSGEAKREAKRVAAGLSIPGSEQVGQSLADKIDALLTSDPANFSPTTSGLTDAARASLEELLAAETSIPGGLDTTITQPDIQAPEFGALTKPDLSVPGSLDVPAPVQPEQIEPFTPSKLEQQARDADTKKFVQQIRDMTAARGLSQSAAGAVIEGELLIQRNLQFASLDFNRTRQLVAEELKRSQFKAQQQSIQFQQQFQQQGLQFQQELAAGRFDVNFQQAQLAVKREVFNSQLAVVNLELAADQALFSQETVNRAFTAGREDELFQRKIKTIGNALQQANIDFNQQQIEFTLDLQSAGLPVQTAIQFMGLVQQGDIAAAKIVLGGIGVDAESQNATITAATDLTVGVITAAVQRGQDEGFGFQSDPGGTAVINESGFSNSLGRGDF